MFCDGVSLHDTPSQNTLGLRSRTSFTWDSVPERGQLLKDTLNWKLKKFSWAETMVSFAGFDEFAGFVFLRTICWFRRNRARFGNAEFYAAMAFHETLLKSRVSSPKPWFRCLDNNFLWNYVHYDLN